MSEVQICNTALARIGHSQFISSLNEQSQEAGICSLFYEQCRDLVFQACPWKFARKRIPIQLLEVVVVGWDYVYSYPNDCMRALRVLHEDGSEDGTQRIAFDILSSNNQKLIVAKEPNLYLEYTSRIADTTKYDPMFASAVAWLLASEIVLPLSTNPQVGQNAYNSYRAVVTDALAVSFNEGYEGVMPDSESVTVRY